MCGSAKVEKQLMTPGIAMKANRRSAGTAHTFSAVPHDPQAKALQQAIRELRRYVTEKADYVGDRFSEEARRMHYREVKQRGIYGEATLGRGKGSDCGRNRGPAASFHPGRSQLRDGPPAYC